MRTLLATLLMSAALISSAAKAEMPTRTITVQGSGSVSTRPDTAVVRAGVETRAAGPDLALLGNNAAMERLLAILAQFNVPERDIATTSFEVSPLYGKPEPNAPPPVVGYSVGNQVTARIRSFERLGDLLTALAEAGSNRLRGVSFELSDAAGLRDDARRAAMVDARKHAELYAQAAGKALGDVVAISEVSMGSPQPRFAPMVMAAEARAVPIQPGELTVSASVTVVYELR
jgi:uncharacterized protein YggE